MLGFRTVTVAAAALVAAAMGSQAQDATLKLATDSGAKGSPSGDAMDRWAELIAEGTDGAVEVDVFYQNELGGQQEIFDLFVAGDVDLMLNWPTTAYSDRLSVLFAPYMVTSWEEALVAYSPGGWLYGMLGEHLRRDGARVPRRLARGLQRHRHQGRLRHDGGGGGRHEDPRAADVPHGRRGAGAGLPDRHHRLGRDLHRHPDRRGGRRRGQHHLLGLRVLPRHARLLQPHQAELRHRHPVGQRRVDGGAHRGAAPGRARHRRHGDGGGVRNRARSTSPTSRRPRRPA